MVSQVPSSTTAPGSSSRKADARKRSGVSQSFLASTTLKGLLVLKVLAVPSGLVRAVLLQQILLELIYVLVKRGRELATSFVAQFPQKGRRQLLQALFPR
jgi:hypothetical protein